MRSVLAFVALIGLIASFHTIIYAMGRQIYSLSRAGYFPTALSVTHGSYKTPHVAMIVGAVVGAGGHARHLVRRRRRERGSAIIGGTLLNMAVFGAMFSYILQAVSSSCCAATCRISSGPTAARWACPARWLTIIIGVVTLFYQLQDPIFSRA